MIINYIYHKYIKHYYQQYTVSSLSDKDNPRRYLAYISSKLKNKKAVKTRKMTERSLKTLSIWLKLLMITFDNF